MNINIIKKLAEEADPAHLAAAEEALLEGNLMPIEIEGKDEGEQLTHILGAIYVKEEMSKGVDVRTALRQYSQKVRNSIS